MKNLLFIFFFLLIVSEIPAQEFIPSTAYQVTIDKAQGIQEVSSVRATLKTNNAPSITLTTFPIEAGASLQNIQVYELSNPGLEGISKVLKIDTNYTEYCSYVVSTYLLITRHQDFISLPIIGNMHCNDSRSDVRYLFPNQPFGKKNQIVRSEVNLSNSNWISSATIQQAFSWNDDDFGNTAALSDNY